MARRIEVEIVINPQTHGTAVLTCVNHPTYRWVQTKYALPDAVNPYGGRGKLMFKGEEGGKPSCVFNMDEETLSLRSPEEQERFKENWTPECSCPESDLLFLAWLG